MGHLEEVGDQAGWRCWLCDEPVDPAMSVNDARGPSIDTCITKARAKARRKTAGDEALTERLAHRGCNTGKGATAPIVPWPDHLFVADPAPILPSVERLERKGGREVMGRCPALEDAEATAEWLVDRVSRLAPTLALQVDVEPGGGQFLVLLRA